MTSMSPCRPILQSVLVGLSRTLKDLDDLSTNLYHKMCDLPFKIMHGELGWSVTRHDGLKRKLVFSGSRQEFVLRSVSLAL